MAANAPSALPPVHEALLRRLDPVIRWIGERYFGAELCGLERLPEGPALLVGNHNAGVVVPDSMILFRAYVRKSGFRDVPISLGHELLFRIPLLGRVMGGFGIIPASPENARRALNQGRKVLVYPGGDWEAMRPSRDRDRIDFGGRKGFVRLAMQAGVPIVPIVAAGAHDGWLVLSRGDGIARALRLKRTLRLEVFPIALGLPTGLIVGPAPLHLPWPHEILIEVLWPLRFEGDPSDPAQVKRAYDEILALMQAKLDALVVRLRRRRLRRARRLVRLCKRRYSEQVTSTKL